MTRLFGDKLQYLRRSQDMIQAEVARQLSVSRAYINNLEASRKTPSLDVVLRVANLFRVKTDYLLRDTLLVEQITINIDAKHFNNEPSQARFGDKLRYLRLKHNMTQADLASRLGLAANAHVSFLETGSKEPSIDLVLRIADLFEITTDYLLRDTIPVEELRTASEGNIS